MPKMDKQYQLILGTFIDDEFVWHDVDSFDNLEEAYRAFKKYVNSQLKYTDEELIKVWNTGRLDVELRRGNKLLNWVGIYAREVAQEAKEDEDEKADVRDALSYNERKALERKKFFRAIGKEDDGRLNAELTRSEFEDFKKQHEVVEGSLPRDDEAVLVYYKYAPYEDISYFYNFTDGKLYEATYHVKDSVERLFEDERGELVTESELRKEFEQMQADQGPSGFNYSFEEYVKYKTGRHGTLKQIR